MPGRAPPRAGHTVDADATRENSAINPITSLARLGFNLAAAQERGRRLEAGRDGISPLPAKSALGQLHPRRSLASLELVLVYPRNHALNHISRKARVDNVFGTLIQLNISFDERVEDFVRRARIRIQLVGS